MRLTIREFNHAYKIYKDDFDLEMMLRANCMTYAKLKEENEKQEEWF